MNRANSVPVPTYWYKPTLSNSYSNRNAKSLSISFSKRSIGEGELGLD